jgi:hypothetical protein
VIPSLATKASGNTAVPSPPSDPGPPKSVIPSEARGLSYFAPTPQADLSEHLWLLARWFYSNPRQGEIFFRANTWPYRRMMRACARLLAPAEQAAVRRDTPPETNLTEPGGEREKNS